MGGAPLSRKATTLAKVKGRRRDGIRGRAVGLSEKNSLSLSLSVASLCSCWLVVSVEWRSYRLPWKESRANHGSILLSPSLFFVCILPSLVGCCCRLGIPVG